MAKSISKLVADSFEDADIEHAEKFLDLALASWKESSAAVGRTSVIALILAGVFEVLINSKAIGSLALGPLTFTNTSLLQQFIPALIAYLVYDVIALVRQCANQSAIYDAMIEKFYPKVHGSGMAYLIIPPVRGLWSGGSVIDVGDKTEAREDKFDDSMRTVMSFFGIVAFPFAFEAQAYFALISKYGFNNPLVWASLIISLFFMVMLAIRMILAYTG